jgi:hypothetical protein
MTTHIGLLIDKELGHTLVERAIEYHAKDVIRRGTDYMLSHIEEICTSDNPKFPDTYANRTQGYCSIEEAYHKINKSDTDLARKIKQCIVNIHQECVFTMINDIAVADIDVNPEDEIKVVETVEEMIDNVGKLVKQVTAADKPPVADVEKSITNPKNEAAVNSYYCIIS